MTEYLTPYQLFQLETYGDILPEPIILPDGETEAREEELQRLSEWIYGQAEQQLINDENDF